MKKYSFSLTLSLSFIITTFSFAALPEIKNISDLFNPDEKREVEELRQAYQTAQNGRDITALQRALDAYLEKELEYLHRACERVTHLDAQKASALDRAHFERMQCCLLDSLPDSPFTSKFLLPPLQIELPDPIKNYCEKNFS